MPTYDYKCNACEHLLEDIVQRFSEKPLKKCPECKKFQLERVISGGIHAYVRDVKTIGQLEDQNTKKYKSRIEEAAAKRKEETSEEPKTWIDKHGGNATPQEINKMTPQQKKRYIMEGKK